MCWSNRRALEWLNELLLLLVSLYEMSTTLRVVTMTCSDMRYDVDVHMLIVLVRCISCQRAACFWPLQPGCLCSTGFHGEDTLSKWWQQQGGLIDADLSALFDDCCDQQPCVRS